MALNIADTISMLPAGLFQGWVGLNRTGFAEKAGDRPLKHAGGGGRGDGMETTSRREVSQREVRIMSTGTIILIVLVLLLIGVIPAWPHSRGWGFLPSGGLGLVIIILIILLLMGRI